MSLVHALKQKLADLFDLSIDPGTGSIFVPAPPNPADTGIKKLIIDFPTGEVIACDWPQLGRFNKVLETTLDAHFFNIDTAAGREKRTRFIAEKFGFISLFVSNSDPFVFEGNNNLIIAHRPYDEALDEPVSDDGSEYKEVAKINTAFWWSTLIDVGALRNLLMSCMPADQVEELMNETLENTKDHTFFTIPAGKYAFYFDNNHVSLQEAVAGTALHVGNVSEPYGILTQDNLDQVLNLSASSFAP